MKIVLGLAVLAVGWGLVPRIGLPPFSSHMLGHMAVVAVAAPLLAAGIAGGPLDPVRAGRRLSALGASLLELAVVWLWHAPAFHHAARHGLLPYVLEQGSFLAAGVALWLAAVGGGPALRRDRALEGVTGLLLTFMHMTLLGALIALSPRILYGHGTLLDQQVGGVIMLLLGALSYLAGVLFLTRDLVRA